jgi:tetratricopeptide (TPR) repeat protein
VVSARAAIADRKLIDGDSESALNLFNEAISDAPEPISDELFAKVLLQIPTNLFVAGKRNEAFDAASEIEKKISSDARKLIGLTTFFITVQYGTEAIRLAEKAIAVDPNSTLARFTLATALRLNFRLSDATSVYRQILEIDEASVSAKLNLADLLRATGDLEKSISYYREVLEIDGDDPTALAGLAISLYLKGDEAAPSVLERATIADPSNGIMHATIAFHQMKSGETFKALDSADRAIAASPTSSWGYIAKARAMRLSGDFDESERLLIFARSLGDFPSLNYE